MPAYPHRYVTALIQASTDVSGTYADRIWLKNIHAAFREAIDVTVGATRTQLWEARSAMLGRVGARPVSRLIRNDNLNGGCGHRSYWSSAYDLDDHEVQQDLALSVNAAGIRSVGSNVYRGA